MDQIGLFCAVCQALPPLSLILICRRRQRSGCNFLSTDTCWWDSYTATMSSLAVGFFLGVHAAIESPSGSVGILIRGQHEFGRSSLE